MSENKTNALLETKQTYFNKPFLRREDTLKRILVVVFFANMFIGPPCRLLVKLEVDKSIQMIAAICVGSLFALFAVVSLFVCGIALSGPVYRRRLNFNTRELDVWGFWHKFATVLAAVVLSGFAGILGWLLITAE